MSFPKVKIWLVECSTGCTCCSDENHTRGPFSTREIALQRTLKYRELRILASQYAARGVYYIQESEAEQLPDGRLISGGTVYNGFADQYDAGDDLERADYR